MSEYLIVAAGLLLSVGAVALARLAFIRTGEIATPWTLFLLMATIDIFMPAAAQSVEPDAFVSAGAVDAFGAALVVFALSAVLFALGYGASAWTPRLAPVAAVPPRAVVRFRLCELILCAALAVTLWRIGQGMAGFSSVREFMDAALRARFAHPPLPTGFVTRILSQLAGTALTGGFICVGILFLHRDRSPIRYGIVWPLVGLVFATSTLFRGTIVLYLLGLLALEILRRRELAGPHGGRAELAMWSGRALLCAAVIAAAFIGYGSIRNWQTAQTYGRQASFVDGVAHEVRQLSAGHGLHGLAAIIDEYPAHIPYLGGKTFRDMLLLPVPRTVWKAKPEWYGIDDITRAMGWPPSTQSAVTMPGELWANFGPLGILLMPLYGVGFGLAYRWRLGPRLRYLYAFQALPLMLTASWMGFTMVMNVLITLPVYGALVWAVVRCERPISDPRETRNPLPYAPVAT